MTVYKEEKNEHILRCTKTGSTQPKLSAACFAVQSYLAAADFVVFSNYCLIGTRQRLPLFGLMELDQCRNKRFQKPVEVRNRISMTTGTT